MINPLDLLQFSGKKRLPIILQTEMAECGLACLAMVVSFHGHNIDLGTLRRKYPISLRGSTLKNIIQIADKMNFSSRPLRLELEEMDQLQTPTILHWDMNHFVILKKALKSHIIIHDPAQGERKIPFEEVSKHFTGIALELIPTPSFEQKDEKRKIPFNTFWSRIIGLKRTMSKVLLLSLVLQLFSLISPLFMQLVVDHVMVSYDLHLLLVLSIGFSLLMFINVCIDALRSYCVMRFSSMLSVQMATNLFRHLIRLPLTFFEKRHIGDIVSRFGSLGQIEKILTTGIVQAIVDGIMAVGTLILMIIYGPWLAGIVVLSVSLYAVIRFLWYRPLKAMTEESIVAGAKESSNFMETIRATQSIKIFGKENQRQVLWQNRNAEKVNTNIRLRKLGIIFSSINSILFGIENVVVIYLSARMVLDGYLSIGMLFAFMSYKGQFTSKAQAFIENMIELKMLGLHLERLGDIALERVEDYSDEGLDHPPITGEIRLENISYRYNEEEPLILDNINLTINPGESVAIIGPSGCGKTTLMKVMMGLFEATSGKIYIDGVDLHRFGVKAYREQIGAVMQDDQLLSGSMSENICFFDPESNQEWIEECAKMAAIADDIAATAMRYNTLIGDMGTTLSGGQKQRVLLARALYRRPRILFLDEATSHLDIGLEHVVNKAIQGLKVTRIIIAHRPETIRSANRIFVMTPQGLIEQPILEEKSA